MFHILEHFTVTIVTNASCGIPQGSILDQLVLLIFLTKSF